MAVNGALEASQFTVKNLLEGCLEESQLPSASEVAWLAYLMSSSRIGSGSKLREETRPPQNCCITHIQSVMAELLKESFTSCSAQIKTTEYELAQTAVPIWSCLMGLNEAPPTSCIFPLYNLSCRASLIMYVAMEIANILFGDQASIMNYLEEMWGAYMTGLVQQCLKLSDSSAADDQLLVRFVLALLIVTILDAIAAWEESGGVAPQGKFGGVIQNGESSEELRAARLRGWKCARVLEPVLNHIKQNFSAYLYRSYCECESRESQCGRGAGESLEFQSHSKSGRKLQVLHSVQYLRDAVLVMTAIGRHLGSDELQLMIVEFTLRLATQSLNHMHKLSEGVVVGGEVRICVLYRVLASLDALHHILLDMHVPSDMDAVLSTVCVRVEEELQDVGVAVEEYHRDLCLTSLLQDSSSSQWTAHSAFFEGCRCSWSIQMWSYHVRGLCHDLCSCLPSRLACVREGVLCGVIGVSLSHLVARYSLISPTSTHLAHYLADIVVILTCVNSLLPWLGGVASDMPSPVMSIHHSCELLVTMAIVQSVSLQQLLSAMSHLASSRKESRRNGWVWLRWVEEHLQVLAPAKVGCVTPPFTLKLLSMYDHEDSSQWAELLQGLLAEGGALCVSLCAHAPDSPPSEADSAGGGSVRWSEGAHAVLHVLSVLPHVSWGLTAVVAATKYKAPYLHGDPVRSTELSDPVMNILQKNLGPPLLSYLLKMASDTVMESSQGSDQWAWSQGLLSGLSDILHREVYRAVLVLLHWVATASTSPPGGCGMEDQHVGDAVAKILLSILRRHVSNLKLPPTTSVGVWHFSHVFQLMSVAMDPSAPPTPIPSSDSSPSPIIPMVVLQQVQNAQGHKWMLGRLNLSRLVAAGHTHQPELMLQEELEGCTLEEHDLAAQLIRSDEEGACSLQDIRRLLRNFYCVGGTALFNPMQEYRNIGCHGDDRTFTQDKLCKSRQYLQGQDSLQSCLLWLAGEEGTSSLNTFIRRWRWELQEEGTSQDLEPEDQQLVGNLVETLNSLKINC